MFGTGWKDARRLSRERRQRPIDPTSSVEQAFAPSMSCVRQPCCRTHTLQALEQGYRLDDLRRRSPTVNKLLRGRWPWTVLHEPQMSDRNGCGSATVERVSAGRSGDWVGQVHLKTLNQVRRNAILGTPLPPLAIFAMTSGANCRFQAVINSPVSITARPEASAEPPPLKSLMQTLALLGHGSFVRDHLDHVVWFEICDNEWACADWAKVGLCAFWCACAQAIRELCRLDDRGLTANEGAIWVWLWLR